MADVFGDLSLFSEFDKEREAQGSFIHYEEDAVRSRIVFEDFQSEEESEPEDELVADEQGGSTVPAQMDVAAGSESEAKETAECTTESENGGVKVELDGQSNELNGKSTDENKSETSKSAVKDEAEIASWLNEQLYAAAEEEAKNSNISVHQLIYERNKYCRYANILDSTRFVPDEESPAVQLIFNNNAFARKYRQQIEQFIKGLLWEEMNSQTTEQIETINVKGSAPSCVDINKNLGPETRTEKMRQAHALIGNCQFHKQFLIDFLGWPFTVGEPTRCNVNWEIPLYSQVFNEVYADPTKIKSSQKKKTKPACWNCGMENHSVAECKAPRNPARIAVNRKEFMEQQQQNRAEPKFSGASRYHLDPEIASKFVKYKPGILSDALREALGLTENQLPQHVYKMRLFGYPPGWLAEAKRQESGVSVFDKDGKVTSTTVESLEDGELGEDGKTEDSSGDYDINKIVEYPGFTIPVPLGCIDEHASFMMPPIQQHQLKKTLMKQSDDKITAKKRKRTADKDDTEKDAEAKKAKTDGEEEEEGSTQPEEGDGSSPSRTEDGEISITKTPQAMNRSISSTVSLSKDYGTPIFEREKYGLPDASKFGQGVEDHIPFENLPNSTGTFEKMRNLIDIIRTKIRK